jgi:hypothetical protein
MTVEVRGMERKLPKGNIFGWGIELSPYSDTPRMKPDTKTQTGMQGVIWTVQQDKFPQKRKM